MPGGKGVVENTANKRVRVVDSMGNASIVAVKNDIGLTHGHAPGTHGSAAEIGSQELTQRSVTGVIR